MTRFRSLFGLRGPVRPNLLALALLTVVSTPLGGRAQPVPAGKPIQITMASSLLAEDRRILIRLPLHYERDATARYAVLYKFDGDNQLESYAESIEVLANLDAMPDLIVVAIPNGRGMRNRDLTPASLHQEPGEDGQMGTGEMGRGDRFLDFVERELIPYIEANYRPTQERILAGHSRGALMVLQSLLSKPDLFQARFMFSAPLMRDEQRLIADTRKFFRDHRGHTSFLYGNWGENENEGMNRSYETMRALLAAEAPEGMRWVVERARAADHQHTQGIAVPSALYEYFAGKPDAGPSPANRLAQFRGGPASGRP